MSSCSRASLIASRRQRLAGLDLAERDPCHPERVERPRRRRPAGPAASATAQRALALDDRLAIVASQHAGPRDPGEQPRALGARLVGQQRRARCSRSASRLRGLVEPPARAAPAHQQPRVAHRAPRSGSSISQARGRRASRCGAARRPRRRRWRRRLEQVDLVDAGDRRRRPEPAPTAPCARSYRSAISP